MDQVTFPSLYTWEGLVTFFLEAMKGVNASEFLGYRHCTIVSILGTNIRTKNTLNSKHIYIEIPLRYLIISHDPNTSKSLVLD